MEEAGEQKSRAGLEAEAEVQQLASQETRLASGSTQPNPGVHALLFVAQAVPAASGISASSYV